MQFCDTGLSHDGKIQAEILPTIAFRGRPGPIYVEGLDLLRQDFTIKNAKTFVGTVMERMFIVEWLTRGREKANSSRCVANYGKNRRFPFTRACAAKSCLTHGERCAALFTNDPSAR